MHVLVIVGMIPSSETCFEPNFFANKLSKTRMQQFEWEHIGNCQIASPLRPRRAKLVEKWLQNGCKLVAKCPKSMKKSERRKQIYTLHCPGLNPQTPDLTATLLPTKLCAHLEKERENWASISSKTVWPASRASERKEKGERKKERKARISFPLSFYGLLCTPFLKFC